MSWTSPPTKKNCSKTIWSKIKGFTLIFEFKFDDTKQLGDHSAHPRLEFFITKTFGTCKSAQWRAQLNWTYNYIIHNKNISGTYFTQSMRGREQSWILQNPYCPEPYLARGTHFNIMRHKKRTFMTLEYIFREQYK